MFVCLFKENNLIEFEEFVDVMLNCGPKDTEEQLHEEFKVFDKDGDGTISADELRTVREG